KSDGNFDADEQNAVREIARALGFDPAEFGL
ncbi:TPA: TerB family tellurite resistance protein, partial [Klebsiella michiganensis]